MNEYGIRIYEDDEITHEHHCLAQNYFKALALTAEIVHELGRVGIINPNAVTEVRVTEAP